MRGRVDCPRVAQSRASCWCVQTRTASGCCLVGAEVVSDDAVALWEAAGRPGSLEHVCPQRFLAPLAPHLAAREEGRQVDPALLRTGLLQWQQQSDVLVVEGVGGLMSPISDDDYVADLARDFGLPVVVVTRNALGAINQTLQTLCVARTHGGGLPVAGVVLNHTQPSGGDDVSTRSNRAELAARCDAPLLAEVAFGAERFDVDVDWLALAQCEKDSANES